VQHPEHAKPKVLVIDDHPMVREGLRSMLTGEIEAWAEASTWEEVVQQLRELEPDLVLLDIQLPDPDGLTILRRIKALSPITSVLVVTMHDNPGYVRQAVRFGAAGYVLKGITRRELLAAVRGYRCREMAMHEALQRSDLQSILLASTLVIAICCFLFLTSALAQEDILRLPPVTVTAPARLPEVPLPPSSIPASVQVITGEEIRKSGALTLQDFLPRLPGVTSSDEQGNSFQPSLSFRGFQGTSVTGVPQGISVFLDGVRINEPDVEEINFDLIPLDDIERIELIRGPSAIFGRNTLAGAVNIITKRGGTEREFVPELAWGSFGRQNYRGHLAGTGGPIDYYFSGLYFHEDGWRDVSEGRISRAFGKLGYQGKGTDVTLSYQYTQNRIEQAGSLPLSLLQEDRKQNFTGGDFFRPLLNVGILNLRQELGSGFTLALNGFGRNLDAEQFNVSLIGDNTRLFNNTTSGGGTLQLSHQALPFGRENLLIVGTDYVHNRVRVKVFEEKNERTLSACSDEAVAAGENPSEACPLQELNTKVRDQQNAFGVYLQDTFDLAKALFLKGDSLVLTAALRWDWLRHDITDESPGLDGRPSAAGVFTFSRVNPRLGFNYNLSPDVGLYFSYSQGFRAPAFLELTCAGPGAVCPGLQAGVASDPPLNPVKARNFELGLRTKPYPWLDTELSLFRTDVSDDIFSVSPTGTLGLFFQNIGDTRRQGLELSIRGTYRGLLDGYVNYSFTQATFRDDVMLATPRLTPGCVTPPCTEFVRKGSDLPLIPNHRLNAGVDYHLMDWLTLSLAAFYVGQQRFRGDEANVAAPLKDYVVLNGGIRGQWKGFTASLWINNLLNNKYETFGTFAPNAKLPGDPIEPFLTPALPINVLGGVSYRF
jgi:outer membrane receptor protein involved in Fe transport/FixJ family two-component response regulator